MNERRKEFAHNGVGVTIGIAVNRTHSNDVITFQLFVPWKMNDTRNERRNERM